MILSGEIRLGFHFIKSFFSQPATNNNWATREMHALYPAQVRRVLSAFEHLVTGVPVVSP